MLKSLSDYIPLKWKSKLKNIFFLWYWLYAKLFFVLQYKKFKKFKKLDHIKLNIGCGKIKFAGWVNIDRLSTADLVLDITKKLPFCNNSIDYIYSEHVYEHLDFEEGTRLMQNFYRCLKPGGIVRIAMPDLDNIIDKYCHNWKDQDWVHWSGCESVDTKGKMINASFQP